MPNKLKTVFVQHNAIPNEFQPDELLSNFQVIETQNLVKELASQDVNLAGLVLFDDREQLENLVNAIRKSLRNPWIPIAVISEEQTSLPRLRGCKFFSKLELKGMPEYFSQNIKPKVLVIEDEEDLQDVLAQALGKHYEVTILGDGSDGLQNALQNSYDVILTDFNLPGLNGNEIISELRDKEIETPIVLITAYDKKELELNSLSSGANEYLPKSVSIQTIRKTIVDVILSQDQRNLLTGATRASDNASWDEWAQSHQANLK